MKIGTMDKMITATNAKRYTWWSVSMYEILPLMPTNFKSMNIVDSEVYGVEGQQLTAVEIDNANKL